MSHAWIEIVVDKYRKVKLIVGDSRTRFDDKQVFLFYGYLGRGEVSLRFRGP